MPERPIILIGGAPTAGKSTLAKSLSADLHLPWISTDQIRNTMRVVADRKEYPDLFNPAGFEDAEKFHDNFSPSQIIKFEVAQAEAAWQGIRAFIDDDYTWTDGFIVEGVNILPHLVARDYGDAENVASLYLIDADISRVREVIYRRGLWDNAASYSDDVKAKEVEWVQQFGEWLIASAKEHGRDVLAVAKDESDRANAKAILSSHLGLEDI